MFTEEAPTSHFTFISLASVLPCGQSSEKQPPTWVFLKIFLKKFYTDFLKFTNERKLLKKKRQWVEALFLSSWACLALEPCPSLSPLLLSCPWVAPAYPPWQLSASPCQSGEIRTADLASRSRMAAPACLGWTPDETRYTTLHPEKQPPSGSGPTSGFHL